MASLDRFVAKAAIASRPPDLIDRLPDGGTSIILRLSSDGKADLHVLGPLTRAHYKRNAGTRTAVVKLLFRPGGGYPFFGTPLTELVDRVVPLRELWGASAEDLLERLADAGTNAERASLLEQALAERLHAPAGRETPALAIAQEAARRLAVRQVPIRRLARDLDLSERTLRRVFGCAVGLSPKRYARVLRFRRALSYAAAGRLGWSEIAVESGYFDQSHMTADFQEFARTSPEVLLRKDSVESLRDQCA